MAISILNTDNVATHGTNIMCYAPAGYGKTWLIKTLAEYNPLILSAESGLLSIKGSGLDYVSISSVEDLAETYKFLMSEEGKKYKAVALDSVSEIAEVCLSAEKAKSKDARQAYMAMADIIAGSIRAFRDLPIHVYMTCKIAQEKDEEGRLLYSPTIPGSKAAQNLPYFFDFLVTIRTWKNEETGEIERALQTQPDGLYQAKARDPEGVLSNFEPMDLGAIIKKIGGG